MDINMNETNDNIDQITNYLKNEDVTNNKSVAFMMMLTDELIKNGVSASRAGLIACTPQVSIGEDASMDKLADLAHHLVKVQIEVVSKVVGGDVGSETMSLAIDRSFRHFNLTL